MSSVTTQILVTYLNRIINKVNGNLVYLELNGLSGFIGRGGVPVKELALNRGSKIFDLKLVGVRWFANKSFSMDNVPSEDMINNDISKNRDIAISNSKSNSNSNSNDISNSKSNSL